MYKIIFKGVGIEPIFVEDDVKGQIIMDSWVNDKKARMVFKNTAFFTGDIKQIVKLEKSEAELSKGMPDSIEKEYLEFRSKMLSLPIEKRANILRLVKMIWAAHTELPLTDEIKEKIIERQLAYFKENPKCIYANPKVYRDLIPRFIDKKQIESLNPIQNTIPALTLRLVETLVQTDLRYSLR